MNIHEFQAKQLFKDYKIPVPHILVVDSAERAAEFNFDSV
jgi:succinyl-CoA synthetase beta subunit